MTEAPEPPPTPPEAAPVALPEAQVRRRHRGFSVVWVVPIVAAIVAGGLTRRRSPGC